jgi:hypothetical protein
VLVLVAALGPANVRAADDGVVVLPKPAVNAALWTTNWLHHYPGAKAVEELIFDAFHYQLTLANPQGQAQIRQALSEFRRQYDAAVARGQDASYRVHQSADEIVRTMLDLASQLPALQSAVKSVWGVVVDPGHRSFPFGALDQTATIAASTRSYGLSPEALQRADVTLQTIFEAAQKSPSFAAAYDQERSATLGASIKDFDAVTFLQAHPAFPVPLHIRQGIQPSGALPISVTTIQDLSRSEFGKLNASIDVLRITVATIDAAQGTLLDYIKDQQKQQEMQRLAEATASAEKRNLDAIKTSLAILSTLGGKLDPKFGKQLSVLTTSGVQVGEAMDKWLTKVAKLKGLDKLGNISTVIMTGNVLSAVMNVVSLFGPSQPTPEQMILQEIGKLRQQVDQLRQEMHSRFDRIDQELNVIYTTMRERFNLIDLQLGKINGNVQEIQKSLIALDLTLSRIERNNFAFLDAEGRRPLLSAINGAIGYRERTGVDMPYQPDFVQHENEFHSWGTIVAFDALSAGPPNRDFHDGQVLGELQALPLDSNINYLNDWITAHGLPPFANARVASPRDWTFASRAYADMGLDWPAHLRRVNAQRLTTLNQVGSNVETAIRHISTRETPTGPQGNKPLFTGVMAYYSGKLDLLDASIQPVETAYVQEVQTDPHRLQRAEPFDLFGGIDQPLTYQTPVLSTMTCGGTVELPAPANLKTFLPHFNRYNLADYLKLGSLKACVTGQLLNPEIHCQEPGQDVCDAVGKLKVDVGVSFGGVGIASPTFTTQTRVIISGESNAIEYTLSHWRGGCGSVLKCLPWPISLPLKLPHSGQQSLT